MMESNAKTAAHFDEGRSAREEKGCEQRADVAVGRREESGGDVASIKQLPLLNYDAEENYDRMRRRLDHLRFHAKRLAFLHELSDSRWDRVDECDSVDRLTRRLAETNSRHQNSIQSKAVVPSTDYADAVVQRTSTADVRHWHYRHGGEAKPPESSSSSSGDESPSDSSSGRAPAKGLLSKKRHRTRKASDDGVIDTTTIVHRVANNVVPESANSDATAPLASSTIERRERIVNRRKPILGNDRTKMVRIVHEHFRTFRVETVFRVEDEAELKTWLKSADKCNVVDVRNQSEVVAESAGGFGADDALRHGHSNTETVVPFSGKLATEAFPPNGRPAELTLVPTSNSAACADTRKPPTPTPDYENGVTLTQAEPTKVEEAVLIGRIPHERIAPSEADRPGAIGVRRSTSELPPEKPPRLSDTMQKFSDERYAKPLLAEMDSTQQQTDEDAERCLDEPSPPLRQRRLQHRLMAEDRDRVPSFLKDLDERQRAASCLRGIVGRHSIDESVEINDRYGRSSAPITPASTAQLDAFEYASVEPCADVHAPESVLQPSAELSSCLLTDEQRHRLKALLPTRNFVASHPLHAALPDGHFFTCRHNFFAEEEEEEVEAFRPEAVADAELRTVAEPLACYPATFYPSAAVVAAASRKRAALMPNVPLRKSDEETEVSPIRIAELLRRRSLPTTDEYAGVDFGDDALARKVEYLLSDARDNDVGKFPATLDETPNYRLLAISKAVRQRQPPVTSDGETTDALTSTTGSSASSLTTEDDSNDDEAELKYVVLRRTLPPAGRVPAEERKSAVEPRKTADKPRSFRTPDGEYVEEPPPKPERAAPFYMQRSGDEGPEIASLSSVKMGQVNGAGSELPCMREAFHRPQTDTENKQRRTGFSLNVEALHRTSTAEKRCNQQSRPSSASVFSASGCCRSAAKLIRRLDRCYRRRVRDWKRRGQNENAYCWPEKAAFAEPFHRCTVRFAQPPIVCGTGHNRTHELLAGLANFTYNMQNGVAATSGGNGDSAAVSAWDATELLKLLYHVDYNPFVEKRSRFRNMEGHLEVPNEEPNLIPQIEKQWKRLYFRTKDGRFQWFATHFADEHPIEDVLLTGTTVTANRDEWTITVKGGKENANITVKTPSNLFDKWLQALLSHSSSTLIDAYIQPVHPPVPHYTHKVLLVELGSCSIRAGILTNKPSLPQLFFPAVGCVPDSATADENSNATPTKVAVGVDAFRADVRRGSCGELRSVLSAEVSTGVGGSATLNVERYQLNRPILAACLNKVLNELQVDPRNYKVLFSIPQNVPAVFVGDLLRQLIREWRFKAASIARQPSLILYSYDVTTGVVVDIGERLNIVPVIDEYIVESAIVSLPFGAPQIRKSLRQELTKRNSSRINAFGSPIEDIVLRYMVELSCNVATDFEAANSSSDATATNGRAAEDKTIEFSAFDAGRDFVPSITVDAASRFHATEGLFKPKRFGVEMKGVHQLIHDAIQQSPIDSRRTLYRNIYLSGGTTLLPGFAERLELELSRVAPSSIFVQVHGSPWRYHASYLGAQVIANSFQFENCCADMSNLDEYLRQMDASAN